MRIIAIAARTHRWPIAGEGAARGRSERASVFVEVRADRNTIGLGEAAPLPGMSLDTLDDAERALAAFARHTPFDVSDSPPRAGALDRCTPFEIIDHEAADAFATSPFAVRFAIETALLDALARERRVSVATLLAPLVEDPHSRPGRGDALPVANHLRHVGADPSPRGPEPSPRGPQFPHVRANHRVVPLAAVVDDPQAARAAFMAGIRCLKIKLIASDDPDRVTAIAAVAPGARLRVDANRTWPRSEVVDRLAALAHLPIEYVEEPCRDAHRLLAQPLPCKLALDESLLEMTSEEIEAALRSPMLAALILKPTLLGGFSDVLRLATLARRAGVAAIVSHTLEGPIGTAACAELALALGGEHPAGLAPHAALAGWSIQVPQLAADHVRASTASGLGLATAGLAGVVHA